MQSSFYTFKQKITNRFSYIQFMLAHLPMGLVAGLRVLSLEEERAVVRVRFCWLNKNPFRSIYFAVLAMAAEFSTGILAFAHSGQQDISMLIVKCQGDFYKKAVGNIRFTCNDGLAIQQAMYTTLKTGEGIVLQANSVGTNELGVVVAKFTFEWSFKAKGDGKG
ncbi:thioesterase [Parasediminibacterium sp. JCM 36343]|uniref:thioesterase n=1 Tax=Parasediminibacterium sp. JCM 36343 TaxID=3374279 RepID=UPI00397A092F